jgi:NFU1 iron-sulfur cluster scaffold homolog, mitochondrial
MEGFVTVYAEATPNPESLKFVFNKNIIPGGSYDYANPEAANESPLARQLFQFNFVKGVFIAQNFVTITKVEDALWAELIPIIRTFLKEYVQADSPILSPENESRKGELVYDENDSESVKRIKDILAQSVRPVVEMDGGNIEFKSFDDGVVTLALKGSCSGCPSSTVTLKAGIENLLKRMVPEVKEVVAEAL